MARRRELPDGWEDVADTAQLRGRWSDPPVAGRGRYQVITRVVHGRHEGRSFWAFATPDPASRHGTRRAVALDAGRPLPTVRVEPQTPAQSVVGSRLGRVTGGRRGGAAARLFGVELDGGEFDRHYRVRGPSREHAARVLPATVRQILLASEPRAVTFEGSDVLVWDEAPAQTGPLEVHGIEPLLHQAAAIAAALE